VEATEEEFSAYHIADLLDEPQRKAEAPTPARTGTTPASGTRNAARRRLKKELEGIRKVLMANVNEIADETAVETAPSKEEEAIAKVAQVERQARAESRRLGTVLFTAASVTLGALPTALLATAFPSAFGQKTFWEELQGGEPDSGTVAPRAPAPLPASFEALTRRQAALEEVARGESGSLHLVYRVGAFLTAAAAFALSSVLAYLCTLLHPLLGVFAVPIALIAPICWWFDELGALGAALRDHPDVFRPPGWSLRELRMLYPPLCLAILAIGGLAMGAACYGTVLGVIRLFTSQA
jgi:hypothetical protein